MTLRHIIVFFLVALLFTASPSPAMCSECQIAAPKENSTATLNGKFATAQGAGAVTAGDHCHATAAAPSSSGSDGTRVTSQRSCSEKPCRSLIEPATETTGNPMLSLLAASRGILIAITISGHEQFAFSNFGRRRPHEFLYATFAPPPFPLSLRI